MVPTTIFCNRCGFGSASDAQFCQRCGTALTTRPLFPSRPASQIVAPHYGGFWIRAVAALIDFFLLLAALFPIRLLFGSVVTVVGMNAQIPVHETLLARRLVRIVVGIALAWAYKAGMESSAYQATLGKLAVHLKVIDLEGNRVSFGRATGRYFAKYLSTLAIGIGYLMVAFDEQRQGLHDRIAGTLVQYRHG
jgi:uncharacterized RDD family membrane protein YckC